MLKIKLSRTGAKNRPTYRVVVAHDRSQVNGRPVDYVGYYLPLENKLQFDQQKLEYWLSKGAQPTKGVSRLLKPATTGNK